MGDGHGDPGPVVLTVTPRQTRRLSEFKLVTAAIPAMGRIESGGVGPAGPKRPPRHPTSHDTLSQLRTIVLLT
jgi:hypothetical protein